MLAPPFYNLPWLPDILLLEDEKAITVKSSFLDIETWKQEE